MQTGSFISNEQTASFVNNINQIIHYIMWHPSIAIAGCIAALIVFKITKKMAHTIISAVITATVWYFLRKYGFQKEATGQNPVASFLLYLQLVFCFSILRFCFIKHQVMLFKIRDRSNAFSIIGSFPVSVLELIIMEKQLVSLFFR